MKQPISVNDPAEKAEILQQVSQIAALIMPLQFLQCSHLGL